ncbi:MAG: hypothetical protein COV45_05060 [Deltaproteobacteria bacterium CG11_big_fil_rev_8_21_14_0_20_47_16]|nr:MAG: hypothetical protein COV45_05060 [Deltaproteobacteria bacterium CG11_big_fil_rev_8_21_14_0_20_47_16]
MTPQETPLSPSAALALKWARYAGVLIVLVGCAVLAGWIFNIEVLKSVFPGFATMKVNTAICLIVAGLGIRLQMSQNVIVQWGARLCGLFVSLIGAVSLSEYIWNWNAHIDTLFYDSIVAESFQVAPHGRMSITTAVMSTLMGISLFAANTRFRSLIMLNVGTALLVATFSLLATAGYFYGASSLYSFGPYATVALHTALSFLVLSGAMFLSLPTSPIMIEITSDYSGSTIARRLLFLAAILPLIMGEVSLWGEQQGYYDTPMGVALQALSNIAVFTVLIWLTAHSINTSDAQREGVSKKLADNEERMRLIMKATNDGIWDWDLTTRCAWSNAVFATAMGFDCASEGNKVHEYWAEHLHPDDRERCLASLDLVINSGQQYWTEEFRIRQADGHYNYILIRGYVVRDDNGNALRMVGSVMDMTHQKRIEEELRTSRDELDAKVQERTKEIQIANESLSKEVLQRDRFNSRLLIQYSVSKVISDAKSLDEVIHKILALVCTQLGWQVAAVWRVNAAKNVMECTDFWHTPLKDFAEFEKATRQTTFAPEIGLPGRVWSFGEPAWIKDVTKDVNFPRAPYAEKENLHAAFGFPILVAGHVIGVIEFFNNEVQPPDGDLMQSLSSIGNQLGQLIIRKEAEAKVEEAVAIREEFTSMVSHELRSPLSVIQGGVEMVLDGVDGPINDAQKKHLTASLRNVDRLGRLINNVLDFQKIESGNVKLQIEPQEVNGLVDELADGFQEVAKKKGLHLELELGKNLPRALYDKDAIAQVVTNLLSNAMKFTEKGKVTIKTEQKNGAICITVADEGMGIKEEDKHKLFKSFSQIRSQGSPNIPGSGLGLAISKKMVEANHGEISVESSYGHGTSFYVKLPIDKG